MTCWRKAGLTFLPQARRVGAAAEDDETAGPGVAAVTVAAPGIFPQLFGPTMPSGTRPLLRWRVRTAASVVGPKMPSGCTPTAICTTFTASPRDPRLSV